MMKGLQRLSGLICLAFVAACQPHATSESAVNDSEEQPAVTPSARVLPTQGQTFAQLDAIQVITGELTYHALEGGVYTLTPAQGDSIVLTRLPQDFQRPGLVVAVTGRMLPNAVTTMQMGPVFEVRNVQVIDDSKATSNYAEL